MNESVHSRPRTAAIAIAGGVALVVAGVLLHIAVWDLIERVTTASLRSGVRVVAASFREDMDEVTEQLRQLAGQRSVGGPGAEAAWRDEAERVRAGNSRRLRGLLLVGHSGTVEWATPDQAWVAGNEAAVADTVARALSAGTVVLGGEASGRDGSRLLLAAAPAPLESGGVQTERAALVGTLDIRELAARLLSELARESSGVAFLASPDGDVVELAGSEGSGASAEGRGSGGGSEWLSELLRDGKELPDRLSAPLHGAVEDVVAVSGTVSLGRGRWTIGVLLPSQALSREARPFLLGGGILVLVLLAVLFAGVVAVMRSRGSVEGAKRETERWRRIAEGAEREGRSRAVADDSREPGVYLRDTRVASANLAAARALETGEVADLLGRSIFDFVPADERGRLERFLVGRVAGANVPEQFQARLVTARGGRRLVEMVTSLVERDGAVVEHLTWRDVTSRERAEALLRAVSGSVQSCLALCDPAGQLVWANSAYTELCGVSAERFLGRPILPLIARADLRRARVLFGRATRGRTANGQIRIAPAEARPALLTVRGVPVHVAGELFGILLVANDITDRELEAERQRRTLRGEVLANVATSVAHRVNNDFQALLGILEKIKHEKGIGPIKTAIQGLIASAADELHRFVLVARTGSASLHPLRLRGLIERWAAQVSTTLPAGVRLAIRRDTAEDRVIGDEAQIELVLDLALAAACDTLRSGGGAIEVSLEKLPEANKVRLAFSDTGEAAEPDGEAAGAAASPLLPVRELSAAVAAVVAQRHEGAAGSRQRAGIGQRVWLDLPLRGSAVAYRPPARRASRSGAILVADDEELVRLSLASALRDKGHEVLEAGDGEQVVETVLADPARIALVVLDLVMPVMDGREVLGRLRDSCPEIPVLISTGYEPAGDAGLAGAEVLIKPFSLEQFIRKVEGLLGDAGEPPAENGTITQ